MSDVVRGNKGQDDGNKGDDDDAEHAKTRKAAERSWVCQLSVLDFLPQ